jgi:hypothetical protein
MAALQNEGAEVGVGAPSDALMMRISYLEEPELEFGAGGRHIDIRFGLMNHGPLDVTTNLARQAIRVGLIGTPETVELTRTWLEQCREEIPAKPSNKPHLFPKFPGFREDEAFRSKLVLDEALQRLIPRSTFDDLRRANNANETIRQAAEVFYAECEYLCSTAGVDVIVCSVPQQIEELRDPEKRGQLPPGESPLNFHNLLKARAMSVQGAVPLQLIVPATADPSRARQMKIRSETKRLQDDATRAWNFHTALYYKARGRPWRLPRRSTDLTTCFIGVSFYNTLDKSAVQTSIAQVFNERGDGVIVRGGTVQLTKDDRIPHLTDVEMTALMAQALSAYRRTHYAMPARAVVHKTSPFNTAELAGARAALAQFGIGLADFVSVTDRTPVRLFRQGLYPPVRGTLLALDDTNQLLYTRGSVQFFETYTGRYIPQSFLVRCDAIESTPTQVCQEMLGLTKMNWNDTQFDGGSPITVLAARSVGAILKYIPKDGAVAEHYGFYM